MSLKERIDETQEYCQKDNDEACQLCGSRDLLTFHHLIPRCCHGNKWFRKQFTLDDMRTRGIILCRSCHSFIHEQFSEKTLGREFNTLEALASQDKVINYVKWAKKRLSRSKN